MRSRAGRRFVCLCTGISWIGLLVACGAVPGQEMLDRAQGPEITGIVIYNQLAFPVTEALVESPASGGFAGCGNILPHTSCRIAFAAREYRRDELVISWREYGEARSTGEVIVEPPATMEPGQPAWLEIVIYAAGQAGARLITPPAGR
jgi:hypothetical protein